ncbi:MAG: hypothetical protein JSR33_11490 [Proteobacteria bacterium]|nr:hypothetical protein [Pseudomonadota bacterium]
MQREMKGKFEKPAEKKFIPSENHHLKISFSFPMLSIRDTPRDSSQESLTSQISESSEPDSFTKGSDAFPEIKEKETVSFQPVIYIEDFGGKAGDSSVDNALALNSALSYAATNNVKTIQFSRGTYYFKTPPALITSGIEISGYGPGRTVLNRMYQADNIEQGLLSFRAGAVGSRVSDLSIISSSGFKGGSAISLVASTTGSPDFCSFNNLYITSAAPSGDFTWESAIYMNGSPRTVGSIGIRDTNFSGCSVFGGRDSAIRLVSVVACNFTGGGIFQAGGLSGSVIITGTSAANSFYVQFNTSYVAGFTLDYCQRCTLTSGVVAGNITNTNRVQYVLVVGSVSGTIQPYWTNSRNVSTTATLSSRAESVTSEFEIIDDSATHSPTSVSVSSSGVNLFGTPTSSPPSKTKTLNTSAQSTNTLG